MLRMPLPGQPVEEAPPFTEEEEGESFMSAMSAFGEG